MPRTLILGFGNPDREDDGVAWHILAGLALKWSQTVPATPEEPFDLPGKEVDLLFVLQLTPDLAGELCGYDQICFVDAHTGAVPEDLNIQPLSPAFQNSPFTHHMTPETFLSILENIYHHKPRALLVSVRGYQFGFANNLSPQTETLANKAIEAINHWIHEKDQKSY